MKTILFMATSVNGFVARPNGEEDFLSNENWAQLVKYTKKYKNLVWGRKTYEAVKSWGGNYLNDLIDVSIIVVSKNKISFKEKNVIACKSPEEAIEIAKKRGYKKMLLSGGPSLNASFLESDLIDEIIINYNPMIIGRGINLFSIDNFDIRLGIKKVDYFSSGIIQSHYLVTK